MDTVIYNDPIMVDPWSRLEQNKALIRIRVKSGSGSDPHQGWIQHRIVLEPLAEFIILSKEFLVRAFKGWHFFDFPTGCPKSDLRGGKFFGGQNFIGALKSKRFFFYPVEQTLSCETIGFGNTKKETEQWLYCMYKKCWPNKYSNLLYKLGQDFLDAK